MFYNVLFLALLAVRSSLGFVPSSVNSLRRVQCKGAAASLALQKAITLSTLYVPKTSPLKRYASAAAQYSDFSTEVENVKFVEVDKPVVAPGMAVVKVHAASINPIDEKVMAGYLKGLWSMTWPFTMGYDIAGVIDSVHETDRTSLSSSLSVGDEVFAVNWGQGKHDEEGSPIGGAFAEYALVPLSKLSKKPASVSFEQAAALALVGTTAHQALFDAGQATEGTRVLILGGPTAVGHLAIPLLKLRGAWVAATTSTRNLDYTTSLGPDLIVNYKEEKWTEIAELKANGGVDVVFDIVGEAEAMENALASGVLKADGRFISLSNGAIGVDPAGHPPLKFGAMYCLKNEVAVQDELAVLVAEGKLVVKIDEVFPFTEAGVGAALTKMKGGSSVGKNVIKMM